MKIYVADTVALARYLEDNLPSRAEEAFREAEGGSALVLVPEVVIGELVYIALKGRLKTRDPRSDALELVREVHASSFFRPTAMNMSAWERFLESDISELHDRIVYSVAVASDAAAILTPDRELKSSGFPTAW